MACGFIDIVLHLAGALLVRRLEPMRQWNARGLPRWSAA
jgi:hypothetical protein